MRPPTRAVDVDGREAAPRLEVGDDRGAAAHGIEVVDAEGDPDLAGDREQVQHEVGRASGRGAGSDTVLERLTGKDALGREAALQQLHDQFAGTGAYLVLAAVEGWRTGRAHR
jgi:hypothetical protein